MRNDYSRDLDTTASYCPFFLLKEKGKQVQKNLDANLIRVAPECHDTCGLACLYRECVLSKVIRECIREKDVTDLNSLSGLRPPHGVVSCCWVVRVTSSINKGHAVLLKWWLTFLPTSPHQVDQCCCHAGSTPTHSEWGTMRFG
jgi:hypothetical protein